MRKAIIWNMLKLTWLAFMAMSVTGCQKQCYRCEKDHGNGGSPEVLEVCKGKDLRAAEDRGMTCTPQ